MPVYGGSTGPSTAAPAATNGPSIDTSGASGGSGARFEVDAVLLAKYGGRLVTIGDGMGAALTDVDARFQATNQYGYRAWGDGEIAEMYEKYWQENASKVFTSATDMQQGLYNIADKMGVTSANYIKTDDASTV